MNSEDLGKDNHITFYNVDTRTHRYYALFTFLGCRSLVTLGLCIVVPVHQTIRTYIFHFYISCQLKFVFQETYFHLNSIFKIETGFYPCSKDPHFFGAEAI